MQVKNNEALCALVNLAMEALLWESVELFHQTQNQITQHINTNNLVAKNRFICHTLTIYM